MSEWTQLDQRYVARTYSRFPVEIAAGSGSLLFDAEGKEYIDLGSGIGVTAFGNGDAVWKAAVVAQLEAVQHTSNLYYTHPCARLAQMLCERTGMHRVFFCNSGAEANECAIKAARRYSALHKGAHCTNIITLANSFHGRTLTTLAATGQEVFHRLFQPLTAGFLHTPANDLAAFTALARANCPAGIMLECIQGEGGVVPLERSFVQGVAQWAQENDVPLIIDEVQTGNGRTGRLYAYMHYGIMPDVVSTAKGLGGGLPLGATMLGEKMRDIFEPGDHGSTFGGNPVCCAGAVSIISRLDDAFLAEVEAKGELVRRQLTGAPGIGEITGMGLMLGIRTVRPAREVVERGIERGILCLTAKDKVRLLPALNIPNELLLRALERLREAAAPC